MAWFDTARFGMFIHWGHYSQQGIEASWPLVGGVSVNEAKDVSVEQYHSSAPTFNPTAWDPRALAQRAKRCGMQYAVLTTKHHDGYAMFHTKTSRHSIEHSPYGRDIVREYVDAFRAEGLRIGLYFSLIDWYHPDYPRFREEDKPYGMMGGWPKPDPERWPRFIDVMFEQIRELLTNYGQIDVLWFDGGWERNREQWKSAELEKMIRSLQPEIIINDRLPGVGDYDTPEQFVPAKPPARRWETCMTMNESWGYNPADTKWKSPHYLIHTLCEVAGRGGNLLLNVGPRGDGSLTPETTDRLDAIEAWMARHGESIVGTTPGLEAWQHYGPSTRRDSRVYAHLLARPYESATVRGVRISRLRSVRAVGSGEKLTYEKRCSIIDRLVNNPDPLGEVTIAVPKSAIDAHATVLALDFEGEPT
jgi:alpha-L-fucosidase